MAAFEILGRGAFKGIAQGEALVCKESIQGWAGIDDNTGEIIEKGHSQEGVCIRDRILILPCSKGSNGWSCHFHSAMVKGFMPAGWIFTKLDSRAGVACAVLEIPTVCDVDSDTVFSRIKTGDILRINGDTGVIEVNPA